MSKIATDTAATLLAVFAGQTVADDEVYAAIEQQYTQARKQTGIGSYAQVLGSIQRAGVTTEFDLDQNLIYTFPAVA